MDKLKINKLRYTFCKKFLEETKIIETPKPDKPVEKKKKG